MPVVIDVTITPTASAPVEMSAIAASPFSAPLSFSTSSKNAASTTIGMEKYSGAMLAAQAIASAPKPTCDNPSPIMEKRLSTRLTPNSAQHSEIKTPTSSARNMNEWVTKNEKISLMAAALRKLTVKFAVAIVFHRAEKCAAAVHV